VNVCEILLRVALDVRMSQKSDVVVQVTESVEDILSRISDDRWEMQVQFEFKLS
jgi:hypothetical protein